MKKHLLSKLLLLSALLGGANSVWAQAVPDPIYKLDFENASTVADFGGVQHGDGALVKSSDARFGKYYQNRPNATTNETTKTTNYLEVVPTTNFWATLRGKSKPISFTLSMWVNAEVAENLRMNCYVSSLFTGYTKAGVEEAREWYYVLGPDIRYAGQYHHNNGGWTDMNDNNDDGKRIDGWALDKKWHHIACVFTDIHDYNWFKITWYLDGVKKGETIQYSVSGDGAKAVNMFNDLDRFVIGGNTPWEGPDNAFAYDDIAIYDYALTDAQVRTVWRNKMTSPVQGTQIGELDFTTGYNSVFSTWRTLKPGDSYHYNFINYNNESDVWNNWNLFVRQGYTDKIVLRADRYEVVQGNGSNSKFSGTLVNYTTDLFGATIDMTVTFTQDKQFNMTSTITTMSGAEKTLNYSSGTTTITDDITIALSVDHSWLDLLSENYSAIGAKIGGNGYTTFANANALDLASLPSGLKAYKAKINGSVVKFTEVNEAVPANTGLLLEGTTDETYSIPVAASASALADNDFFVNETGNTFSPDANTTYFGLIKNSLPLTFGVFAPATVAIPANKAYLKVADTAARELVASFDDDVTSIETVKTQNKIDGVYYNLAGQRVVAPVKGLYIVNGKKCIIK